MLPHANIIQLTIAYVNKIKGTSYIKMWQSASVAKFSNLFMYLLKLKRQHTTAINVIYAFLDVGIELVYVIYSSF